jgi:hypothetical protein
VTDKSVVDHIHESDSTAYEQSAVVITD